ncbi:MarR family winged helix-turn-helix transcriptional regulator [Companilactobacillus kimchiensis]|uniref:MarR family transcriptional regulator n=1 Tax=Companilactobacillus kimchiensis TaxID=993692 RepID=A0A0R2LFP9_9LACO|nr:MarR family transcriptional regulator [Companilactobacillus kimchiensis]KRO00744.1 MarR family transcriptional regulator [Companilactobacillus kimchiensis]
MNKQEQFQSELNMLLDKMTLLSQDTFKAELPDYKSSEVHTVEFIGKHADSNVTTIANSLYVTKGAVSKMSKRLINKGLIESYRDKDNQKERYFHLTPKGQEVFDIHERLTKQIMQRDESVFKDNADQIKVVLKFLKTYNIYLDKELSETKNK